VLRSAGKGVAHVRNVILQYGRRQKLDWLWMLDDDLFGFSLETATGPVSAKPLAALLKAQELLAPHEGVAIAGLATGWRRADDRPLSFNRDCYSAVALRVPLLTGLAYREELLLKEDTDFTLQVLHSGHRSCRVEAVRFQMPQPGTHAGGLAATYAADGKERAMAEKLLSFWPKICTLGPKAKHCRIRWEAFDPQPAPLVDTPSGFRRPVFMTSGGGYPWRT
jgi:hypothetical protein